jgi:hypothetical protein
MTVGEMKQAPFATTLMGVVRAVADYFGLHASDAMLFGATGHAFMINIDASLCPSGPYCWNRNQFDRLASNLGIAITNYGFFSADSGAFDRADLETTLRPLLGEGFPFSVLNMEHQLITGCDAGGFVLAQPWGPEVPVTPRHLSFRSWNEFGGEVHASFYSYKRCDPASFEKTLADCLDYAIDLRLRPQEHTSPPYAAGSAAYPVWIEALRAGHGESHGSWWNSVVWSECRKQAGAFFEELGKTLPYGRKTCKALAAAYGEAAEHIERCGDKSLAADPKIEMLEQAETIEEHCLPKLQELRNMIGAMA